MTSAKTIEMACEPFKTVFKTIISANQPVIEISIVHQSLFRSLSK